MNGPRRFAVEYDPRAVKELKKKLDIYTVRDAELLVLALQVAHRSTVYRDL